MLYLLDRGLKGKVIDLTDIPDVAQCYSNKMYFQYFYITVLPLYFLDIVLLKSIDS